MVILRDRIKAGDGHHVLICEASQLPVESSVFGFELVCTLERSNLAAETEMQLTGQRTSRSATKLCSYKVLKCYKSRLAKEGRK